MRPTSYLPDFAETFGVHLRSVRIVDRSLSENGLRRKGTGRVIPDPNLREKLLMILAVNLLPDEPLLTIAEATRRWSELPCFEGEGRLFEAMKGKTLIEGLENLCGVFAEDHELVPSTRLQLNKSLEVASLTIRNEHVSFAARRPAQVPDCQTLRLINGIVFARVAGD
jgi:hypothetical protein